MYILHQNIDGLINKSDMLTVALDELTSDNKSVDVLCITEHNMTSNDVSNLNVANYKLATCFCRNGRYGGSCILIKNSHKYIVLEDINKLSIPNVIECSAIELPEHQIYVICIYRPPSKKNGNILFYKFLNQLDKILLKFVLKNNIMRGL